MSSQKQTLLQLLQQKKQQLITIQQKCQLQQKKIKLFRKQNEQLTSIIEQQNQLATTTLLHSKELLTTNTKLQSTIQQLKQQLKIITQQSSHNTSQQPTPKQHSHPTIVTIKNITITQSTLQLDLPSCQLTDDDFGTIHFGQLKTITVNDNLLTGESVAMICVKFGLVEKLNLANNQFQAQALVGFRELKCLKTLDIRSNNLGDDALKYIASIQTLTDLSCSKNAITDAGTKYLQTLTNLTYLDITNNNITTVNSFILLQKLTHLYLMSNKLSKEGIIKLLKESKSLQFLDVRFNVWTNEEKESIRLAKNEDVQLFC